MIFTLRDLEHYSKVKPDSSLEFQAWHSMHVIGILGWAEEVHSAELLVELPGPIYVFLVNFEPRQILENQVYVIGGVLSFFSIDLPHDRGLKEDALDRLLLYFAHLLLFCYCRPRYITPFPLVDCLTLAALPASNITREYFIGVIRDALLALNYEAFGDFMPILSEVTKEGGKKRFLDAGYYQTIVENPIDVEIFTNIGPNKATETSLILR